MAKMKDTNRILINQALAIWGDTLESIHPRNRTRQCRNKRAILCQLLSEKGTLNRQAIALMIGYTCHADAVRCISLFHSLKFQRDDEFMEVYNPVKELFQ